MKTWFRYSLATVAALMLMIGCDSNDISGYEEEPPAYLPQPGDENLKRSSVDINRVQLLKLNSYPTQFYLVIDGTMPTPCHQVRVVVADPNAKNQIKVDVYSVVDPSEVCIQVLQSFSVTVDITSPPPGTYTIRVNNEFEGDLVY